MEKITKKEAIQALSDHYQIPIETIITFIKSRSKENKTAEEYKVQMYISPKEANRGIREAVLHGWRPISITTTDGGVLYILFEKGE